MNAVVESFKGLVPAGSFVLVHGSHGRDNSAQRMLSEMSGMLSHATPGPTHLLLVTCDRTFVTPAHARLHSLIKDERQVTMFIPAVQIAMGSLTLLKEYLKNAAAVGTKFNGVFFDANDLGLVGQSPGDRESEMTAFINGFQDLLQEHEAYGGIAMPYEFPLLSDGTRTLKTN